MNATNIKTDKSTQKLLTAIVFLQVLTLMGLWTGQRMTSTVNAAIPDPGAQREAMVAELKVTNEKLDKLADLMKNGEFKVKVVEEK